MGIEDLSYIYLSSSVTFVNDTFYIVVFLSSIYLVPYCQPQKTISSYSLH